MKHLIKSLYTKGTVANPLDTTAIKNEINLSLAAIKHAMALPARYIAIDATLYDAVNVGSIDVTVPETGVAESGLKPVVMGKAAVSKLKAKKYPVILVATKEQLRYSDFENLLSMELTAKLTALATKKMFEKLASTITTPSTDLAAALSSMVGASGVIVTDPANALKLYEKYAGDTIGEFKIIANPNVTGTHIINDDALVLSMGIEYENSKDALLSMSDAATPAQGAIAGKVLSMFQSDLTAFKFELFIDAAVMTGGYAHIAKP